RARSPTSCCLRSTGERSSCDYRNLPPPRLPAAPPAERAEPPEEFWGCEDGAGSARRPPPYALPPPPWSLPDLPPLGRSSRGWLSLGRTDGLPESRGRM